MDDKDPASSDNLTKKLSGHIPVPSGTPSSTTTMQYIEARDLPKTAYKTFTESLIWEVAIVVAKQA